MQNLFIGIGLGILLTLILDFILWMTFDNTSKRIKAQDFASHQFFFTDSLWYLDPITFNYKGQEVTVRVTQRMFTGTKNNCKLHRLFINNKECATTIKTNDTVKSYFAAYVDEPFIEEEVWNILEEAYVTSRLIVPEETTPKVSILE